MNGTKIFVSYTSADRDWAEWIAWVFEEAGAEVTIQAWDFRPGSNFVLEMQRAAAEASHTIAVLSPDYLRSAFAAPEWAAALVQDPKGVGQVLLPVRVKPCQPTGLLRAIVYADLVTLDEVAARDALLGALSGKRGKPAQRPRFPGAARQRHPHVAFPGSGAPAGRLEASSPPVYVPKIRGTITDLDRSRFFRSAFEVVQDYFERATAELSRQPGVQAEVNSVSADKFTVAVYVHGESRAHCKIWFGGMAGGNGISYYEGPDTGRDGAMNESLTLARDDRELALAAMMHMGLGMRDAPATLNPDHMTPEEAADYLWRRFMWRVE